MEKEFIFGVWLQRFGFLTGLNERIPAEKMCVDGFLDLSWSEDEVAVEATAHWVWLLLINFAVHPFISLACLVTEKGKCASKFPLLSVFTFSRKLGLELVALHSTATNAPLPNTKRENRTEQIFS